MTLDEHSDFQRNPDKEPLAFGLLCFVSLKVEFFRTPVAIEVLGNSSESRVGRKNSIETMV